MTKPELVGRVEWVPSTGWLAGERWELCRGRVSLGRIFRFPDGYVRASVYLPINRSVGGLYSSMTVAAQELYDHCVKEKLIGKGEARA